MLEDQNDRSSSTSVRSPAHNPRHHRKRSQTWLDRHAEAWTRRYVQERYTYPKRRLQEMVIELVRSGGRQKEILQIVSRELVRQDRDYFRYILLEGLWKLGPKAHAALGAVEKLLAKEQQLLAKAKDAKERAAAERAIAYIQNVRDRIKPPKPKGAGDRRQRNQADHRHRPLDAVILPRVQSNPKKGL